MATVGERILGILKQGAALDDDELASRLGVVRQQVNQVCRQLASRGLLIREIGGRGKIINRVADGPAASNVLQQVTGVVPAEDLLKEDEVKVAVRDYLEARGYEVEVMWGRNRGVDIDARGPRGRVIAEAKGDAPTPQMQGNYFLGALGELLQRMSEPDATYALALPENSRFRGLVSRLPRLAKERLRLRVLFVSRSENGYQVREET